MFSRGIRKITFENAELEGGGGGGGSCGYLYRHKTDNAKRFCFFFFMNYVV